jgi:hypothetical protein
MTRKSPALHTPAEIAVKLRSSITQVSDLRLELSTLGLDQVRHQPTPLQNQLLAAACTSLEAWVEIQKTKLERMEWIARKQDHPAPPDPGDPRDWAVNDPRRIALNNIGPRARSHNESPLSHSPLAGLCGPDQPPRHCAWNREEEELFVISTSGIQLGPQNPPTPEIS